MLLLGKYVWLDSYLPFDKNDFIKPTDFVKVLKTSKDVLTTYIKTKLSPDTEDLLKNYDNSNEPDEEILKAITHDLNQLLKDSKLYNNKRFEDVNLDERTKRLIEGEPKGRDLMSLNRLLLEQAYPDELSDSWFKHQESWSETKDKIKALCSKDESKKPITLVDPVTIVVGGTDKSVEIEMRQYKGHLATAFEGYEGTIISGGTTAGIPGRLGAVVGELRKKGNHNITLIAYLPEQLPKGVKKDNNYTHIIQDDTDSNDFTPLQPLQNWIDIISSGIHPSEVRVLGINGGRIAAFEFKLALALGATVGIIEKSGRAVYELLPDAEWWGALRLPLDEMTVRAFVNPGKPRMSKADLTKTAKEIHKQYRKEHKGRFTDPAMVPWPKLKPGLKASNIEQAKFIEAALRHVGFGVKKASGKIKVPRDYKSHIQKLAPLEHGRWIVERLQAGWKYGPERDHDKKISPSLVGWEELTSEVQKYDIEAVKAWPNILKKVGLQIYKQ
jgi:hypothetical protein